MMGSDKIERSVGARMVVGLRLSCECLQGKLMNQDPRLSLREGTK